MNIPSLQDKIDSFFQKYPEKTYDKGVILIFGNEEPLGISFIKSGKVIVYEVSPQGEKVIINTYKNPAFFPMSWAINNTPNAYFYEVQESAKIYLAPKDEVLDFLQHNPDVLLDLLSRVYRGAEGLLRRTAHLMGGRASSRLIYEIIVSLKRFGEQSPGGTYSLTITETELAERTGLTRETVSREIQKLKKSDLLTLQRGTMVVANIKLLEDQIGDDL
jgi:CRP/FNR family transcriptional regulator